MPKYTEKQQKEAVRQLEGSVPVHGNQTPITRRPVEELRADLWPEMSLVQLLEQRRIMTNRIGYASSTGNGNIIVQLEQGLKVLDNIIAEHGAIEEVHLF